ncbi:hypothetical protein GJ496_004785 [Pomphorhynchus laevis]|nr:hypothetical protein GJ496_004785 [Pomphorhynchus laevis]
MKGINQALSTNRHIQIRSGKCAVCKGLFRLNRSDCLQRHEPVAKRCRGSGRPPWSSRQHPSSTDHSSSLSIRAGCDLEFISGLRAVIVLPKLCFQSMQSRGQVGLNVRANMENLIDFHIIQVTPNEQCLPNYSSLIRQRVNDGDSRIKHDVELKGKRQFKLEKVIIPKDLSKPHARGSAVKMSCLTNVNRPNEASRLSDKTNGPNDEGLIHPCLQVNFEPFHSVASRRQSGILHSQRESSKNTDKHNKQQA